MCGIFCIMDSMGILNNDFIYKQFQKGKYRDANASQKLELGFGIKLGFHHLYNNNNNNNTLQPIIINNIALVCNGNILNYKELFTELNIEPVTEYDFEIIIHLYNLYGIERTLELLDGEFSFVLYDMKIIGTESNKIFIGRDPLGVKPLYVLRFENKNTNEYIYTFASDLKIMSSIYNFLDNFLNNFINNFETLGQESGSNVININNNSKNKQDYSLTLKYFNPGTYSLFEKQYTILSQWKETIINKSFFSFVSSCPNDLYCNNVKTNVKENFSWITKGIQDKLYNAVKKRYLNYFTSNSSNSSNNSNLTIGCLLSGGFDSSIITSLVWQIHREENKLSPSPIETFSIGLQDSEDLKYAKRLSNYLETETTHHEIIVSEKDIIDAIPDVIKIIETYDLHTIRNGVINYLLGKYIKENSKAKIIFGGNGADELFGGYKYLNNETNGIEFDMECRKLVKDSHLFDLLSVEKCFSSHGLEISCPFLDKNFINFYLSIPTNIRFDKTIEKFLIRNSFSELNYHYPLLPNEILWRKKNNLNRGFWTKNNSLSKIIQDNLNIIYNADNKLKSEKKYYKNLFDVFFPLIDSNYIIPYFWEPKSSSILFNEYVNEYENVNENEYENEYENVNENNYIVI